MKDLKSKNKKMFIAKRAAIYLAILFVPLMLLSSQLDESLVDDVTAMITNAKKIAHTTFLIDTSESMNQFAFSDYINTCADAEANINHAILLCDSAYNQCRTVEQNAMCGVNLGCGDILVRCNALRGTRTTIDSFCTKIGNIYSEPGKTTVIADPLGGGANDARKFVGPWDPRRADYLLDLCFYNWTEDTGGDVMSGTNSGHYSNPGGTDRRDWDCMTDGVAAPQLRGGLWLNWKYSTSLDAVKIILADTHQFSYPPRARGERKCVRTEYFPYKDDHILGRICYREFETNPGDPATFTKIKEQVRANWLTNKTEVEDSNCTGTDTFTVDFTPPTKDTTVPNDPLSVDAESIPCDVCYDEEGNEEDCVTYASVAVVKNDVTAINGITATVDYSCCANFECTNPKCRDDDTSCRSDGGACVLGYYSEFDQDQNHCCDLLLCIEPADPATCAGGGTFLPGPGNDFTVPFEESLGMPVLSGDDKHQNVTLTAQTSSLTFSDPANVDKVVVSLFYGCNKPEITPSTPLGNKIYYAEVVAPDNIVSTPVDLSGCDQEGYKVGGTMQIFHSGADFSPAVVSMDLKFFVSYDSGSDQTIKILDPALFYYYEYQLEATGEDSDRVNEYECKTTMYHKQSLVVNGGKGNCPSKHPSYARCVYPDHMVIAMDQWRNAKKTACSWLCRDDAVYDDVWKCRSFFAQMDNPARGGLGKCSMCYGDDPATLEACCACIETSGYQFLDLEPPETVRFALPPAHAYNCSVSGFEEGETSDGKRTFTSGYMAEVVEGHIKELGDSSYKLNIAGYVSPYEDPTNKWYSDASLINKSNSFLGNSFVSVFETGKSGTRDTACIYDLLNNFDGEDCMDCLDIGCCSVEIGGGSNMCDYPAFWMKIPNTEGGQLIFQSAVLTGGEVADFKTMIKELKARGGSSLGETLYDVWRYLGGMYSVYDPAHNDVGVDPPYISPFQGTDVSCFNNNAVIVSGGQPQFDDNYAITAKTTQPDPADLPYVVPDGADIATTTKPYVETNWYLTSLEEVANWVHTKDFYHSVDNCKLDNNVNVYGYEVGGFSGGHDCTVPGGEDTSGLNVIDSIHTVAVGDWALAPLYNNPDNDYLETSVLQNAAVNNNGQFFGLTAEAANQVGDAKTFYTLTDMFDAFINSGTPDDVASGMPHWSTSLVQPFGPSMQARGPESYSTVVIPVDNRISRFWLGNFKKYTVDDGSSGCNLENEAYCGGWWTQTIPDLDCFAPDDPGGDISDKAFRLLNAGGAAWVIKNKLDSTAISCSSTVEAIDPCYNSGARNIIYDDNSSLVDLQGADPAWFQAKFNAVYSGISLGETVQILDYIYGYDAFDYNSNGKRNEVRFSKSDGTAETVVIDDPFNIDFDSGNTTTIRPTLLGGIIHSRPVAVHYGDSDTTRIFVGANDGMFHSFDQDGNEAFAYIPMPALPRLTDLLDARTGIFANYSVDGQIELMHVDYNNDGIINGEEKAYLIFGYRRGAKYYTVLDISELDKPKFVQHIQVEGQSWAKPLIFRKCDIAATCTKATDLTYYLAVPGGYDPCFDADTPACRLNAGGHLDPEGNHIYIYKHNGTSFDLVKDYTMGSVGPDDRDDGYMRVSFTARPIAVNTSGYSKLDTEFVYFTDMSSTVFRVDVRESNPDDWKLRAVFKQRSVPQPIAWGSGIRAYAGSEMYPPLYKWESAEDKTYTKLIPIPVSTGNAANMLASEIDEMMVFYDRFNYPDTEEPITSDNLKNMTIKPGDHGTSPWAGFDGWKQSLIFIDGNPKEKIVRRSLVYYDKKEFTYSLELNSYLPAELTECKNWGRNFNYGKSLINGLAPNMGGSASALSQYYRNNGSWSSEICFDLHGALSTEVSVLDTSDGDRLTFSEGGNIFISDPITPLEENPANIIKWYELY